MPDITENLDALILLLYAKILDRPADEDGFRAIVNTVKDEDSLFRVVTNFLGSSEVKRRHLLTTSVAELYGEFVAAHPNDTLVNRTLRRVLEHHSGKKYLSQVESFSKTPASRYYFGSIWLSEEVDRIEGWLVLDERIDRVSVGIRIQDGASWDETLPVEGDVVLVDIALEDAVPDHAHMLFDEKNSVISIGKNPVFRDRLFCAEYYAATASGIDSDPFDHFLDQGVAGGMKFNPFCVPGLEEVRRLDVRDLLQIGTLDDAFHLTGLLDAEYSAYRAGLPQEEGIQHASGCVMRNEWVDFNPLLGQRDFRRHGFGTILEWLERLTDPSRSLADLDFDRFSPTHYRRTCDGMIHENELVDYMFNAGKGAGDPHPFCNTRYAERHLPEDFIWPRRGIWADSFCEPEKYRIPFSPFWNPSALVYRTPPRQNARPDPAPVPLDTYLYHMDKLVPSPLLVPSALVHRFLEWPIEECYPEKITGRDVVAALEKALSCRTSPVDAPKLSVLILNYNKAGLSIVSAIAAAVGKRHDVEVIVLDNGSHPADFATICDYTRDMGNVRTVHSPKNLYFGEGNNVLIDMGSAELVLFLNNDAFVGPTMIDDMIDHLDGTPEASAVGPTFLFPDLTIQEAGGTISNCGRDVQMHKGASLDGHLAFMSRAPVPGVQYISAACLCLRRSVIEEIGGFDYIYEPFYFEDIDLCKRMETLGRRLDYLPGSFVIHYENASTRDFLHNNFAPQLEGSRGIFRERWMYSRPDFRPHTFVPELKTGFDPSRRTAVVCTPFDLVCDDRGRSLLSWAVALSRKYNVLFCSDTRISRTRMSFLIEDLRIDAPGGGAIRPCLFEEVPDWNDVEVMIAGSDEIIPPVPMRARVNIVQCGYPRPSHRSERFEVGRLDALDAYFVESDLVEYGVRADQRRFGRVIPIVTTGAPVAAPADPAARPAREGDGLRLLDAGPFEPSGDGGPQNTAIDIFGMLHAQHPDATLSLMGPADATERGTIRIGQLKAKAGALPIEFHLDPSLKTQEEEFGTADVYLDTRGCTADPRDMPEPCVGAVLRAMAAGCIPLVYEKGAPAEIGRLLGERYVFGSSAEAAGALRDLIALGPDERAELIDRSRAVAMRYIDETFQKDMVARIEELTSSTP